MEKWIPLFQALIWPMFLIGLVVYFRNTCFTILGAIAKRIESGATIKAGFIELGAISKEFEQLPDAPQEMVEPDHATEPSDWRHARAAEYQRVGGYMLVHVYRPSSVHRQKYQIFLFLVRHERGTAGPPRRQFQDIEKAEFYFGDSWGNRVFPVENSGDVIGVRTHAWGTFLACCRITFKDKQREPIILFRYVDFHMLEDAPEID